MTFQEPLRMVAIYSQLLQKRFGGKLGPTGDGIYRLHGARRDAHGESVEGPRTYTQVSTMGKDPTDDIDAGEIPAEDALNLQVAIATSGASISSSALPKVRMSNSNSSRCFRI
jgi:light-regulated signal transduction histidine kinase (bacteriophytochrome)